MHQVLMDIVSISVNVQNSFNAVYREVILGRVYREVILGGCTER